MQARWHAPRSDHILDIPPALLPWMQVGHSMTQQLQAHTNELNVRVLHEQWRQPSPQECHAFNLPMAPAFTRQVALQHAHTPWIVAHSIIPRSTCQHSGGELTRLQASSLGHYLYQRPTVRRHQLAWALLKPHHAAFQLAAPHDPNKPTRLWARRSALHWQKQAPIIVYEIFLTPLYGADEPAHNKQAPHHNRP